MGRLERGKQASGSSKGSWLSLHYVPFFETMFLAVVLLNVLDLWTSAVALGRGLVEGNGVVVALANFLGLQVVEGLAVFKIMAISGGLIAAMLGIREQNPQVRKAAMLVMVFLTLFLLGVSLNNLYMINVA